MRRWALFVWVMFGATAFGQSLEVVPSSRVIDLTENIFLRVDLHATNLASYGLPTVESANFAAEPLPPAQGKPLQTTDASGVARNIGVQWRFILVPIRGGRNEITVTLNANGTTYREQTVIQVNDANAPPTADSETERIRRSASRAASNATTTASSITDSTGRLFVRAFAEPTEAYNHGQITYRFRYYFENWQPKDPQYRFPEFKGFTSREIAQRPASSNPKEQIDGRSFYVEEITLALFPLTPGAKTIPPTTLLVPAFGGRPQREIRTEPLSVNVKPLPSPVPTDFSGAVGDFVVSVELMELAAAVGDSVRLHVNIVGRGNLGTITMPPKPTVEGATLYDPKITDREDFIDGLVGGTRNYEYVLIPQREGTLEVSVPEIVMFSPTRGAYVRSDSRTRQLAVAAPRATLSTSTTASGSRRSLMTLVWIGLVIVVVVAGAFAGRRVFNGSRPHPTDVADAPMEPPYRASVAEPSDLKSRLDGVRVGDGRAVCRQVADIVRQMTDGTTRTAEMGRVLERCAEGEYAPIMLTEAEQKALIAEARRALNV
ncbi:MAG: BatD family protein [Candidatus Poribacteria bacterium]|nr:BatD family protein [Candidatus Poribacteria bacterium]